MAFKLAQPDEDCVPKAQVLGPVMWGLVREIHAAHEVLESWGVATDSFLAEGIRIDSHGLILGADESAQEHRDND